MAFRCKRRVLHIRLTSLVVTVCTMVALLAAMAQTASAYVPCPSGENRAGVIWEWETTWPPPRTDAKGVTMCLGEAGLLGIDKGWLQIVDTGDGASLRVHGRVRSGQWGDWHNPDTLYDKRTVNSWYEWLRGLTPIVEPEEYWNDPLWGFMLPGRERLFSTINGGFFTETENGTATTLPFPFIYMDAEQDTLGLSYRRGQERREDFDYEQPKKVLNLGWPNEPMFRNIQDAEVNQFPTYYEEPDDENQAFFESIAHVDPEYPEEWTTWDSLVGFGPSVRIGEEARRNYVGTYGENIYIFTSDETYTNAAAAEIMQEIQPGMEVIQLDGGGSASLYSAYGSMDSLTIPDREVPNVLAVYRGP